MADALFVILKFFSVFAWGYAAMLTKNFRKMSNITISQFAGDFRYGKSVSVKALRYPVNMHTFPIF